MSDAEPVRRRARAAGILTSYNDAFGRRRRVPTASLRAILMALGRSADGRDDAVTASLAPAAIASFEPEPVCIPLAIASGEELEWELEGEGESFAGRAPMAKALALPALAPGYYRLCLRAGKLHAETLLVRAPARAWLPPGRRRDWGFSVQLYELAGPHSLGIGDFADLAGLAAASGRMGAALLGVNPLHALFLAAPGRAGPYSPSSRLALNPLYLDVSRLPGLDEATRKRLGDPRFAALNREPLIDYATVAQEKLALCQAAFARHRDAGGDVSFARYRDEAPAAIEAWARYETIAAAHGADWHVWPAALRDSAHTEVARFAAAHASDVAFYLWLQWQCEAQLAAAAGSARAAGMAVGLYRDLALGADPAGAEVWAGQHDFVAGLAVGAPPDPLNPRGQNWGFPPFDPERLLAQGFAPFIALLRANMRHAGALRIDHVLGLNRLFVVPQGFAANAGAYLAYPLTVLLAVVVLESWRAHCVVIGEDLGTVPRGLRPRLARRGILSQRLLYFERDRRGRPQGPDEYPRTALVAIGTHDLAPLAGWWRGEDLMRMDRLRLWPDARLRAAMYADRPRMRAALAENFRRAGFPGLETAVPAAAVYRWLARTPSRFLMIQPEDALGLTEPVNVPGTTVEEPNWCRRRLPPWPEWMRDPRLREVVNAVAAERGDHGARGDEA